MREEFVVCVDDDNVDILDWISTHFSNGNWHKNFEVTVSMREVDYTEDGERFYVDQEPDLEQKYNELLKKVEELEEYKYKYEDLCR